ncbi:o-succinylbenzoate synthase [Bacillus sp. HMF5848]|uniref:o-succinylbenzoate synthase n=1 Tax=Bacillus sp. HMF5848 TaxID=2495421 RepID=UPI000F7993E5|nr:o-succinylbenzoate synthase [Bacillus sp. HMF5848]RSK28379.1 o-succinylbenzoate synthase [Bacillus sp. HMF5848]
MKIDKVIIQTLQMPLKFAFETSLGKLVEKDFLLIRLYADGVVGYGESVAMPYPIYNEETTGTVLHMLEKFLIPALMGRSIEHPDEVSQLFAFVRGNRMAKAALEGAVWDAYCKQKGISLARELGGTQSEIAVGVSLGIEPTVDKLLEKIDGYVRAGYKKIKVKIKKGWDIEVIRTIREEFGYDLPLMADANSAYSLDDIDHLQQLDPFKLMMIEQPLGHDDIIDHAKLQAQLSTPICLDESILSAEDARKAVELDACRVVNIKIGRVGGISEAKKVHDVCAAAGIPVWCGGMLEAGVGRAHNIAITSLSHFTIAGDTSASNRYWHEDIIAPEVILSRPGMLAVPEGAGIGYELNEKVIAKHVVAERIFE